MTNFASFIEKLIEQVAVLTAQLAMFTSKSQSNSGVEMRDETDGVPEVSPVGKCLNDEQLLEVEEKLADKDFFSKTVS